MKQENALIIFQKNLVKGKVKTRLAKTMGDEQALKIYSFLVDHTHKIARKVKAAKFWFYSDFVEENNPPGDYQPLVQQGDELGERMLHAFKTVFDKGFRNVIIIGTDCFELTSTIIEEGFFRLQKKSFVLGPAEDGGYYLLGMNELHETIFRNKNWSSETVFRDTLHNIIAQNETYHQLPVLNDVDTEKDAEKILYR
jgi:uncharacterized protein